MSDGSSKRVDAIAEKVGNLEDGLFTMIRGKKRSLEEAFAEALEDTTPESPGDLRGKEDNQEDPEEDSWL